MTVFGQDSLSNCKKDTLHMMLAYETENQWYLDDMILKDQEFVCYDNKTINLKTYKKGVFNIPFGIIIPNWKRLAECKIDILHDTSFAKSISYPFNNTITKSWSKTNSTFAGKGETMLGQKINKPPKTFTYKIFDMTFVAINMGLEERNIVNMDRLTKLEKETVTITCPVYYIIKILNVKTLE
jgi:hypothetical protein